MTANGAVYGQAAVAYLEAGWHPLPVITRDNGKGVVPAGFTGYAARKVKPDDIERWLDDQHLGDRNVCLRLMYEVGLDIDSMDETKKAREGYEDLVDRYGPLPDTIRVSSRLGAPDYDGLHGTKLFRLPESALALVEQRVWRSQWDDIEGLDVIRLAHRQQVVWPSLHEKSGRTYGYLDERTGEIAYGPLPHRDSLPELPEAWLEALLKPEKPVTGGNEPQAAGPTRQRQERVRVPDASDSEYWTEGRPCKAVLRRLGEAVRLMRRGHHDNARDDMLALTRLGEQGHQGVAEAVDVLHGAFLAAVEGRRSGGLDEAEAEWDRMLPNIDSLIESDGPTPAQDRACCPPLDPTDPDDGLDELTVKYLREKRARNAAEVVLREEEAATQADKLPEVRTLRESLDDPQATPEAVLDGLLDKGDRLGLVGARKVGKTSLTANLLHSLLTGEPFLGESGFPLVRDPVAGVLVLNYEMTEDRWVKWTTEAGLDAPGVAERLHVWHLRGTANPLAFDGGRKRVTEVLARTGSEVLLVDTYAAAFVGCGDNENDNSQGQRWGENLAQIVGPDRSLVLTAHTGVTDDGRIRGGSWFEGWLDSYLIMQKEEPRRFLRGVGRARSASGQELEEKLEGGKPLGFDSATRRMWLDLGDATTLARARARGGSERKARAEARQAEKRAEYERNQRILLGVIRDRQADPETTGAKDLIAAMAAHKGWVGGTKEPVANMLSALSVGPDRLIEQGEPVKVPAGRGTTQKVPHRLTAKGEDWLDVRF